MIKILMVLGLRPKLKESLNFAILPLLFMYDINDLFNVKKKKFNLIIEINFFLLLLLIN